MNKRAIVTGGSSGIGKSICLTLADDGYDIVFNYNTNEKSSNELKEIINKKDRKCEFFKADIRSFDESKLFIDRARDFFGDPDILVNNAGITRDKSMFLMSEEDWQDVINTNLNGYFNITRQIITAFLKRKSGSIVNITSVSGLKGLPGQSNYCASKAGIIGLTRSLAVECAKKNVTVNCIAPGFIESEMVDKLTEKYKNEMLKLIPMNRFGTTQEVADLVVYLVSEKAKYITGQTFVIDGGMTV